MKWYCVEQEYKLNGNVIEEFPKHYYSYTEAMDPF